MTKPTIKDLYEFAKAQNPEHGYSYMQGHTCLLAQFYRNLDMNVYRVDSAFVYGHGMGKDDPVLCELPEDFDFISLRAAPRHPNTFTTFAMVVELLEDKYAEQIK